ncbi:2-amino-4-hydroxy-6-hydroxymethyldihydropteridinediphosphokinase OS=Tsukamurella paurometabola (strain ATCC 8368 / DSM / CCUG 35730 / CIP 100753 / JCM 10117 / KCTC 9821 / NBRC 16120 / NCIMB 702349 / NCTC 13040)OX=521096 GN=Tpau_0563 PE=4 SV=1 [Tsukamurella paurometabola]|uniref:2-amino-4-hydroxy-6-hydroxymethyldihydropteridine diphosphokinase n=1 Tax=Tsukamurella paurometabola (strain ATCC 8368 / DSM 20162 / CCUG 35730 / CIP 100753 / JCM 10117 / KCTC 9821 / NBRC 16120 / NCIMB 702349 / NCTC 13040) TaxID=521096 RepID=D5USD6_TSUPD|nr:2-amino-4-hydroxy-6-hydroxymethyldihydropteridine diphosphokinase [Tsukamurella paurometabola]ADG77203.1 2-amino-4-hydroxy-6-hydroxymethyldihydropteridin epyrophosphokinase [Tsukamurella paurometabola DSM 20162]SUP43145.1 Bifunctional folate synthesis protein [Tsukamurella paurometabola]
MTRAVLSIGANLGDAETAVRGAITALGPALVAASPLYRTPPWGGVEQDDFINATVLADDPSRTAAGWLDFARDQEAAADRIRDVRWGPRTLDVDVIAVWDAEVPIRSDDPELTLPHPRAHQRAFVLVPWRAVDPAAELPGHGTVDDLLAALPAGEVAEVTPL